MHRSRPRTAGRSPAQSPSHDPRISAAPRPAELSLHWRGLEDQRNRLIRYVPWWVVVAAALAIVGVTFAIYYTKLANQADPLHERLAQIGIEDFALPPPPAPPAPGPTLKKLLAPEEAAGDVDGQGGRRAIDGDARGGRAVQIRQRRRELVLRADPRQDHRGPEPSTGAA